MRAHAVVGLAALAGLFVADRVTKMLALKSGERAVLPLLSVRPTGNAGIAFSLPLPAPVTTVLVTVLVIIIGAVAVRRFAANGAWFPWGLVAVGGTANLFDRFRYGHVVDFIAVGPLPVFNLADLMILAGIIALAFPRLTEKTAVR